MTGALWGKLPSSREFVRSDACGDAELALADALAHAVEAAHGEPLGAAQFLLGMSETVGLAGCWVDSHDQLGRAYPLVLSYRVPDELAAVPLAARWMHGMDLLEESDRLLCAARSAGSLLGEGSWPHVSTLLPRLHVARARLMGESLPRFTMRMLGSVDRDALAYALWIFARALARPEPLAVQMPSPDADALFAWLELAARLSSAERRAPTGLVWQPARGAAWLGLGLEPHTLIAIATTSSHRGDCWPLCSADPEALAHARVGLGEQAWACIERGATLGDLVAQLQAQAGSRDGA